MKRTQAYAKRSNVPVDNLVTFSVSVGGAVDASVCFSCCLFPVMRVVVVFRGVACFSARFSFFFLSD